MGTCYLYYELFIMLPYFLFVVEIYPYTKTQTHKHIYIYA